MVSCGKIKGRGKGQNTKVERSALTTSRKLKLDLKWTDYVNRLYRIRTLYLGMDI